MPSPWLVRELRSYGVGRSLVARFPGRCAVDGTSIEVGTRITRNPTGKGYLCSVCSGFEREEYEGPTA